MIRRVAALLLMLLAGRAALAVMHWPDLLNRPQPKPNATVAYGADPLQHVDLWLPQGAGPHPVVLMVHGGCWQTEVAKADIMNWIAGDLRGRGIAVWNVEYRGIDRPVAIPAPSATWRRRRMRCGRTPRATASR